MAATMVWIVGMADREDHRSSDNKDDDATSKTSLRQHSIANTVCVYVCTNRWEWGRREQQ